MNNLQNTYETLLPLIGSEDIEITECPIDGETSIRGYTNTGWFTVYQDDEGNLSADHDHSTYQNILCDAESTEDIYNALSEILTLENC